MASSIKHMARLRVATAATAATAALTLGSTAAWAGPVISPFAADLAATAYSADSTYPGGSAQSVFNGGHWNSGGYGVHWIQADMGSLHTLSEVRLTVDVWPYNNTWQKVYLSDNPIGNLFNTLTEVDSRSGYTVGGQQFILDFAPTAGRYLQIVSYGGASWTALGDVAGRSNWVDKAVQPGQTLGQTTGQVPEPGGLALVAAALGAAWLLRRQGMARATPSRGA